MTPARGPWYISARAVRDYLALCQREGLLVSHGALRYRGPKPPEGDLPQLVGVLPGHGGGDASRR